MGSAITRANPPLPAGTGGATYKPSGVIERKYTATGTTNVMTEETLWTYTLPANTLNADGQSIRITAHVRYATNANTKTTKLYFGAANRQTNLTSTAPNGSNHTFQWLIVRTGAATQLDIPTTNVVGGAAQTVAPFGAAATETLSGPVVIKITGQNGTASANDIVLHGVIVEFIP